MAGVWDGVGVFPTPLGLTADFAFSVVRKIQSSFEAGSSIRVLDACAGDGRLGDAVAKALVKAGFSPDLTLVDVDLRRANFSPSEDYRREWIDGNFFEIEARGDFDVVISNPPYLAISRGSAQSLNISWEAALRAGRNLYGLAMIKSFEHCTNRGIVGLIAPHGWMRNRMSQYLRGVVAKSVSNVYIRAFGSRRIFPDVNQDTSIQIFEMGQGDDGASIVIEYDDGVVDSKLTCEESPGYKGRVRVGPFVWNREGERISKGGRGIPVVYGGNILTSGNVDFDVERYAGRKFLALGRTPDGYISAGPCFVVKRSMRGKPGAWRADCAFLKSGFEFVAENHVIVVSCDKKMVAGDVGLFRKSLMDNLERLHRDNGHANLAVDTVRKASLAASQSICIE